MNRFRLYGIGNALLDYEYLVDDSILKELEIEKGTMLLNEHDKHLKIHFHMKIQSVLLNNNLILSL